MTARSTNQGELFMLDSPLLAEVRGEQSLMAYPFFALSKSAWKRPLVYKTETVSIEIGPGPRGVATIYDKEVLLYIASLMAAKLDAGEEVTQDFYFTAYDLFRVTGVNGSARSYSRLSDALERLQGTQIKTDIEAGGEGQAGFFSWLSEAQLKYTKTKNGDKRLKAVRVRLCDWLYRAILTDQRIAAYHHDFFKLGPIERRLYELAKFNCKDDGFTLDIGELAARVGCASDRRGLEYFKKQLRDVSEQDSLPEYTLDVVETKIPSGRGGRPRLHTTIGFRPKREPEVLEDGTDA